MILDLLGVSKLESISPFIVFGSSRSDGNTKKTIDLIFHGTDYRLIDLNTKKISYYDYEHANKEDDFITIAEEMVTYQHIVLATPVYWYTMSAMMKTFLDRWSDLLRLRKDLGKSLTNKWLYIVTSYATDLPVGFESPFQQTCMYMNMNYGGCYYHYTGEDEQRRAENQRYAESFKRLFF